MKGERVGIDLGREELLLCAVQRSAEQIGDSKVLNVAMAKLLGADLFCTHKPHLTGEKVFGSQKYKANVLLGFEGRSHHLIKVNFFRLQIVTRSVRANHASCSLSNVVE
jgi:hypothetical protein